MAAGNPASAAPIAIGEFYPKVLEKFIELNSGAYGEAVLTGGIECGKTTMAVFTTAYQLYLLSLKKNPQKQFGLARGSEIVFVFQSVNSDLAKNVDYARFKALIDHAPYFRKHFRYQQSIESELRFPNRIVVRPLSGRSTAALGQNVYGGVIDEMNYMETIDRSKRLPDAEEYDQAKSLYNTIARRRASRFMKIGNLPGVLCLVSPRRYPGQFTDLKERQRDKQLADTGESPIYVYDKRVWDVKPKRTYSGEIFRVFTGDETRNPRLLEPGEDLPESDRDLIMEVPVEHRDEFEADLPDALRELAGVALLASRPFFTDREAVAACFGTHDPILSHESAVLGVDDLCFWTGNFYKPELFRWVHLDLSSTGDATGIVIGCIKGFKKISRGDTIRDPADYSYRLRVAGSTTQGRRNSVRGHSRADLPGKGPGPCRTIRYRRFIPIRRHNSNIEAEKFLAGRRSMDKDPRPYETLKAAIYGGRLEIPKNDVLLRELVTLDLDTKTGKIDHLPRGSKDVADALAGVVYELSTRVPAWKQHGHHPKRDAPNFTQFTRDFAPDNLRDSAPYELHF